MKNNIEAAEQASFATSLLVHYIPDQIAFKSDVQHGNPLPTDFFPAGKNSYQASWK